MVPLLRALMRDAISLDRPGRRVVVVVLERVEIIRAKNKKKKKEKEKRFQRRL